MAIIKVRDQNGHIIEIPALRGKTAYQYALDGGYTGTEEEFKKKMAEDVGVNLVYKQPPIYRVDNTTNPLIYDVIINVRDLVDGGYYYFNTEKQIPENDAVVRRVTYVLVCDDKTEKRLYSNSGTKGFSLGKLMTVNNLTSSSGNNSVNVILYFTEDDTRIRAIGTYDTSDNIDHTVSYQYSILDKNNTHLEYTPTHDYQPATKKYVDDSFTALNVQADYAINDDTDKAYIKNRPFYESEVTDTEILLDEYMELFVDLPSCPPTGSFSSGLTLNDGDTYTVTFCDVTKTILCENGRLTFDFETESGLDIYIITESEIVGVHEISPERSGNIKIEHKTAVTEVKQLNEKYIPDTIARKSDIPIKASDIDAQISDFIVNIDDNLIADKTWSEVCDARIQGRRCYAIYAGNIFEYATEGYDHYKFICFTGDQAIMIYLYDYTQDVTFKTYVLATKTEVDKKVTSPTTATVGQILSVEEVNENGKPTKWKTIDLDIPTNVSTLTNDAGYQTEEQVSTVSANTTLQLLEATGLISMAHEDESTIYSDENDEILLL